MLTKHRMAWNHFVGFFLVILICMGLAGSFSLNSLRTFYKKSQEENMSAMGRLVASQIKPFFGQGFARERQDELLAFCNRFGRQSGTRLTIILPSGEVVADSEKAPELMGDHSDRPEILGALTGATAHNERLSDTLQTKMLYLALPVEMEGKPVAVVRLARSLEAIDDELSVIARMMLRGGVLAALLAMVISYYLSLRMSRPIEQIRQTAERLANGDFSHRLYMDRPAELMELTRSMNKMAQQLHEHIGQITRQRNEREAILVSMREGVLAVDMDQRVIMINHACARMLSASKEQSVGRLVQEVTRHPDLQKLIAHALKNPHELAKERILEWPDHHHLQVTSAPLIDQRGQTNGVLIVINDVTRLHELENVRREFVANVSHELRTPITSIKGFIETLRDGALEEPDTARRFLEIIERQAQRLEAIIEDLLALSRIEREAEVSGIHMQKVNLSALAEELNAAFMLRCEQRGLKLVMEFDPQLQVKANERLLAQAVGNLVDNAIKYTKDNQAITVRTEKTEHDVLIHVIDQGCGIAPQHLPRLFERFYRADAARSREMGGTGLGLAIVKHIVQAHGGKITVQSQPGEGSQFTIWLPALDDLTQN